MILLYYKRHSVAEGPSPRSATSVAETTLIYLHYPTRYSTLLREAGSRHRERPSPFATYCAKPKGVASPNGPRLFGSPAHLGTIYCACPYSVHASLREPPAPSLQEYCLRLHAWQKAPLRLASGCSYRHLH